MNKKFRDLKELSSQIKEPFVKEEQNIFKYWRKNEIKYIRIKYTKKHAPAAFACLVDIQKVYKIKCYMLIIGCLPKYRKKGITTKLVKSILRQVKEENKPVFFHILKENYKSKALFEKLSKEVKIRRMPEFDYIDEKIGMKDLVYTFEL